MAGMKVHHAAAIAVAGWYLMMPPLGNGKVYLNAPLSMWQVVASLETLEDCKSVIQNYKKHPAEISDPQVRELIDRRNAHAMCVSEEDPRVAK
jgi:hypothetical protein